MPDEPDTCCRRCLHPRSVHKTRSKTCGVRRMVRGLIFRCTCSEWRPPKKRKEEE